MLNRFERRLPCATFGPDVAVSRNFYGWKKLGEKHTDEKCLREFSTRDAFTGEVDFYDSRWKILFEVERVAYGRIEGYIRLGK